MLGILAFLASFIPLLSLFTAIPLAIAGFIFAMVGSPESSSGKANNKGTTTVGLIASIVAAIISISLTMMVGAWLGSPDSGTDSAAQSSNSSNSGGGTTEEDKQENQFSGQKPSDVVGGAGESLNTRGVTGVTAEPLALESVSYSDPVLCSYVEYENNSNSRLDYHDWDWSLQSPSGDIKSTTFMTRRRPARRWRPCPRRHHKRLRLLRQHRRADSRAKMFSCSKTSSPSTLRAAHGSTTSNDRRHHRMTAATIERTLVLSYVDSHGPSPLPLLA